MCNHASFYGINSTIIIDFVISLTMFIKLKFMLTSDTSLAFQNRYEYNFHLNTMHETFDLNHVFYRLKCFKP